MAKHRAAPRHLLLYSTNTLLAFRIAERYFGGKHYVWCTPYFDSAGHVEIAVPPTSCPSAVYHSLWDEVQAGDLHSAKIVQNRLGLKQGALIKFQQRVIDKEQREEIEAVVEAASVSDFRPLLYVIPYTGVADLVAPVPVSKRAHPLSTEYIIDELPRQLFDPIELRRRP